MTNGKRIIQKKLVNQTKGEDDALIKEELDNDEDDGYLGLSRREETLQLVWNRLRRNNSILEKMKMKKKACGSSVGFILREVGVHSSLGFW